MSSEAKLAAGFGAALFILAVLATSLGFREVRFIATTIDQIGALVLTLALVAVVIERAVEVFVSKSYDPEKLRVTRPVARAEAKLAKAEKLLAEERERRHGSTRVPTDAEEAEFQQLIQVAQHAQQQCECRRGRGLAAAFSAQGLETSRCQLPLAPARCARLILGRPGPRTIPSCRCSGEPFR